MIQPRFLATPRLLLPVLALAFSIAFGSQQPAQAQSAEATPEEEAAEKNMNPEQRQAEVTRRRMAAAIQFETGTVSLSNGVRITLPPGMRFLSPVMAEMVLTQIWRGLVGTAKPKLGLIVPETTNLLDKKGWIMALDEVKEGHYPVDGAEKLNFDEIMTGMLAGNAEAQAVLASNRERFKTMDQAAHDDKLVFGPPGARTIVDKDAEPLLRHLQQLDEITADKLENWKLNGWAMAPVVDKKGHSLIWASEHTSESLGKLESFEVRVLGKESILTMQALASARHHPELQQATASLAAAVAFPKGERHADHWPWQDVAPWKLETLIWRSPNEVASERPTGMIWMVEAAFAAGFALIVLWKVKQWYLQKSLA